jgi:DNA-binding winged helix-turn-helix (wHTH) protein
MQPIDTASFDLCTEQLLWIGPAAVEPPLNQIRRNGSIHRVEPRVMRVLLCLAARPGEVLTRSALLDAVWTDALPNDEGLTQAVCKLRKAFGDRATRSTVIETIPKVGYRLIASVSHQPVFTNGHAAQVDTGTTKPQDPLASEDGAPPRSPLHATAYGIGRQDAEWRWLAVCFGLLILFCGLWTSYLAEQSIVPEPRQRILIHRFEPGMNFTQPHALQIKARVLRLGTEPPKADEP